MHDGIAGGVILRCVIAARDRGARRPCWRGRGIARQRDLRRAGQRHGGVEHAFAPAPAHTASRHWRATAARSHAKPGVPRRLSESVPWMAWPILVKKIECGIGASSNSLEIVVLFHAEGAEAAVRRLVRGNAGRDRPVIALDAVDRDGHLLVVLVDGDGDFGLRGAGGEQRQAGEGNEEGTHFTFGLQALIAAPGSPSPASIYARNPALVPVASWRHR